MTRIPNEPHADDRLLRLPEVQRILPVSRSTIYSLIARGQLAPPTKLGPRISAWRESQVHACIANMEADRAGR